MLLCVWLCVGGRGGGSRRKSGPKTQFPHSAKPGETFGNFILEFWDVQKRDGVETITHTHQTIGPS